MRYPKYNKTKRPRRSAEHNMSTARWYIFAVQAHLLKYHKNAAGDDDAIGDRSNVQNVNNGGSTNGDHNIDDNLLDVQSSNDYPNENQENLTHDESQEGDENFLGFPANAGSLIQRMQTEGIPENDGHPHDVQILRRSPLKRKVRSSRVGLSKKFKT